MRSRFQISFGVKEQAEGKAANDRNEKLRSTLVLLGSSFSEGPLSDVVSERSLDHHHDRELVEGDWDLRWGGHGGRTRGRSQRNLT